MLEFDEQGTLASSRRGAAVGFELPERVRGICVDPKEHVRIGAIGGYEIPLLPDNSDDMLPKATAARTFVAERFMRLDSPAEGPSDGCPA